MTFNEEMIKKYMDEYKVKYMEKFNETPKCWFTYLKWLSGFTSAGSFSQRECNLADELLNN